MGGRIVERGQRQPEPPVIVTDLNAQGSLRDRRPEGVGPQHLGDTAGQPKPFEPCTGENKAVIIPSVEPAQPRVDVAADATDDQVAPQCLHLGDPPHARRSHHGPRTQRLQRARLAADQHVERHRPDRHACHGQSRCLSCRQILEAVHGGVNPAVQQGPLEFADKHAIPANGGYRHVRAAIPLRGNRLDFHCQPLPTQLVDDPARLGAGQHAGPRADADGPVCGGILLGSGGLFHDSLFQTAC